MTKPASRHVTSRPEDRPAATAVTAAPPALPATPDVTAAAEPAPLTQQIALFVWAGGFLLLLFLLFLDLLVGLFHA
jgi:hypothetical protein